MNNNSVISCGKVYLLLFFLIHSCSSIQAQSITWGPIVPAINADNLQTCEGSGMLRFGFTNSTLVLNNPSIEIQLDSGINYVQGSLNFSSDQGAIVSEGDLSNLNRPQFNLSKIEANEFIQIRIDRTANCQAMDYKINGNSFRDSILIYDTANPVSYLGGNGTVEYDLTYAILSITNPITAPSTTNIASQAMRTLNITNGSFGAVQDFYFADIAPSATMNLDSFVINPNGNAISIPSGNINIIGDSVIIHFDASLITAIDGSQGNGDGNSLFEKDEQFVLSYQLTPALCGSNNTISSTLLVWWGCDYNTRCQVNESGTSLGLTNGVPILDLSNPVSPGLDFCDTITYSMKITNNSSETLPAGGTFAKDLAVIIGLRSNNSPIATPTNMTMWGSDYRDIKFFANIRINDSLVVAGTLTGIYGNPVDYIPADFFTTDPDGVGGIEDIDNDGYFDDLAKDSSIVVSFDVYIDPRKTSCGTGRYDYIVWEHISADVSWENQCGIPMSPLRQEFNYTNYIRDYLVSTEYTSPTDIIDGETFSIGIKPHLYNTINCNGASGNTGSGVDWTVFAILPQGISLAPGATYAPTHSTYAPSFTQSNDTVFYSINRYTYDWFNFDLQFDCSTWDNSNPVVIPIQSIYSCKDENGNVCFEQSLHCNSVSMVPHCNTNCVGVSQMEFTALRTSGGWTDNTKLTPVSLNATDHVLSTVYPKDTVQFISLATLSDTMTDNLFARIIYSPDDNVDLFVFAGGTLTIIDKDGGYNSGQIIYNTAITAPPR